MRNVSEGVLQRHPGAQGHVARRRRAASSCSLLGPSGCGKSTALRIIAGPRRAELGPIDWPIQPAQFQGPAARAISASCFQEPTLMPWADGVRQCLPAAAAATASPRPRRDRDHGSAGLGGARDFTKAYPRELSGGMKMRVSIARALVTKPKLLLMDEPFAALDEITRQKLNDDVLRLWRETGITVIFVTHSVFESCLSLQSHRRDDGAAGPGLYRHAAHHLDAARLELPHLRGISADHRQGVARPAGSHRVGAAGRPTTLQPHPISARPAPTARSHVVANDQR